MTHGISLIRGCCIRFLGLLYATRWFKLMKTRNRNEESASHAPSGLGKTPPVPPSVWWLPVILAVPWLGAASLQCPPPLSLCVSECLFSSSRTSGILDVGPTLIAYDLTLVCHTYKDPISSNLLKVQVGTLLADLSGLPFWTQTALIGNGSPCPG